MSPKNNRRPLLISLGWLPNKFCSLTALKAALDCVLMFQITYYCIDCMTAKIHITILIFPLYSFHSIKQAQTSTEQENAFKPQWFSWEWCHNKPLFSLKKHTYFAVETCHFCLSVLCLKFCFLSSYPWKSCTLSSCQGNYHCKGIFPSMAAPSILWNI